MTNRQRILAAIRGETPDRIPFVPRLEFWHRGLRHRGALPRELADLSLMEIADRLGVGYYAILPDTTDASEDEMADRAMGIIRQSTVPYRISFADIDRRVVRSGCKTVVDYRTPVGTVRTSSVLTEEMLAAGASDPWVTEHAIKGPEDFPAVGYLFSHLEIEPDESGYRAACEQIGERGIVVGFASGTACPIQHIMAELIGTERFFYALQDHPAEIERLAAQMQPYYASVQAAAADSPAEVVMLGGNYDDSITHPAFFRRYILPPLREYAAELHRRGKYLLTHTDGENRRLLRLYLEAGVDVADSVCPHPMTRCRFEEIRQVLDGRITVVGGIPSILLCPESASLNDFRKYVDAMMARHGRESRLILAVSDMVTADADWDRFAYISQKVAEIS